MDEKLTKTSEDSGKWYTGITGQPSPWKNGNIPPLDDVNLNKIENALLDFLGSGGVVNNIEKHLDDTVEFVGYDSDDPKYSTSLAGKIQTLRKDVDENKSNIDENKLNIDSVIQKTFGDPNTLNSSSSENNIIKRVGAAENSITELNGSVNNLNKSLTGLFDEVHDEDGQLDVYIKSEVDNTFATKIDVENEFTKTNSNINNISTEVNKINNTLGSSDGTGTVLNRIDALETGVYKKSEVDNTFAKKDEVYSKTEIDNNIASLATPIVESKINEMVPDAVNNEVSTVLGDLLILRCGSATENIEE